MEDIFQEPSPSFTTILSQWKQQDAIAVTQTPSRDHISSLGNSSHHKQQPDTKVRKKSREDVKKEIADLRRSKKLSKAMSKRLFRMPKNVYQQPLQHQSDYVPPQFPHTFVEQDLIRRALGQNFVFSDLTHKDLVPLVAAFETCTFAQGEVIIRQGDPGDYFYILQSGTVSFHVNFRKVGQAGKGASFGELALLYTCPRAATVEAMEPVTLFRVDQMTFRHILQTQTKASEDEKMKLLEGVNFLRDLTPSDLKKLAHVMTPRVFQKEEVLVKKGDPGDAFYIIQEGEVLVKDISVGTTVYEDQTLGAGEYFGERSLATSEPRAANVVGLKKGIAFSIDRSTFEKILGGMSQLILKAQDVRKLSGVSVLQKANLDARQLSSVAALITDRTYSEGASLVKLGKCYEASLYFVREGEVRVDYGDMRSEVVGTGGYFGQEMIESLDGNSTEVVSTFDAVCTSRCHVGVLMLSTCRTVFDVSALVGSGGSSPPTPTVPSITMDDLEKHRILGEGTFGQVWLVTMKDERDKVPYALKVQVKNDLEREGQLRAVVDEKRVLEKLNHPFIVRLVKAFHNPSYVYMMLEMVQGGELFSVLHEDLENPGLPESQCRFYALAIGDALAHMHRSKIVFRDLKPENVLIDAKGYPKLIDFGFAKYVPDKTYTLCGTPGYLPPEVVMTRGHDCSADHWSFGILIYEMLTGENPFYYEGMDQMTLFRCIVQDMYEPIAVDVSFAAEDLIDKLLVKDPTLRLGSLAKGEQDIFEHAWFESLDLVALRAFALPAPWVPAIEDPMDTRFFDDWSHLDDRTMGTYPPLKEADEALFDNF